MRGPGCEEIAKAPELSFTPVDKVPVFISLSMLYAVYGLLHRLHTRSYRAMLLILISAIKQDKAGLMYLIVHNLNEYDGRLEALFQPILEIGMHFIQSKTLLFPVRTFSL